jgi:hypothetical protein
MRERSFGNGSHSVGRYDTRKAGLERETTQTSSTGRISQLNQRQGKRELAIAWAVRLPGAMEYGVANTLGLAGRPARWTAED